MTLWRRRLQQPHRVGSYRRLRPCSSHREPKTATKSPAMCFLFVGERAPGKSWQTNSRTKCSEFVSKLSLSQTLCAFVARPQQAPSMDEVLVVANSQGTCSTSTAHRGRRLPPLLLIVGKDVHVVIHRVEVDGVHASRCASVFDKSFVCVYFWQNCSILAPRAKPAY